MKKKNIKLLLSILSIIFLILYFLINSTYGLKIFTSFMKFLSPDQKKLIRHYILPYQKISILEKKISVELKYINNSLIETELEAKKNDSTVATRESEIKLSNNLIIKKYKFVSGFNYGIWNRFPGSGYIDFHNDDMLILSARGVLIFKNKFDDKNKDFKIIKNNIDEHIGFEEFKKHKWFSIKDLLIYKDKIFVSYTEQIKKNCWNTSIIYGNINKEYIQFNKLFSNKDCIHEIDNKDKEFNAHSSGGRMTMLDDSHIFLSVGDYRERYLAQDEESINGKIIKININSLVHTIISMGHRNPQGLYFDKINNFLLETEHGPKGGDEINLIDLKNYNKDNIKNYGWPISSAGEHYTDGFSTTYFMKKRKYPLYKSHKKYGFIEPLKSFVPSIGISEIVKISKNKFVASSLRDKSLYFFDLNNNNQIINLNRVEVYERIRDLRFDDNKLYLFMENTASLGVINLNNY